MTYMFCKIIVTSLRARIYVDEGVEFDFFKVRFQIFDVDAALGFIFSAGSLPINATSIDTYFPLLALYCKFMTLIGENWPRHPATACIVVGTPSGSGGREVITFGATIQGDQKDEVQEQRLQPLEKAFATSRANLPQNRPFVLQKYGHCAEKYPYICNIDRYAEIHWTFTETQHIL